MSDNNTENKTDWSKRELGALWKNQGRSQTYLTGHVTPPGASEPVKVIVFSNKNKNKDNQPDFRVYLSETRTEEKTEEARNEPMEELLEEV
ncbi:hypothetical protein CL634_00205 [bacterium]|nr:hypothetical protein [bacterium]|tara:strand:+ start:175 stop:447 length:273 start_codon:yes stop_codon:yes gene_type:complete